MNIEINYSIVAKFSKVEVNIDESTLQCTLQSLKCLTVMVVLYSGLTTTQSTENFVLLIERTHKRNSFLKVHFREKQASRTKMEFLTKQQ